MSPDPSYSENSERKSLSSFPYWLQGTHSQSLFSEISALLNLRRAHTAGYYKTVNQWTYKPVQRRCRTCCDHWWSAACSASLAERCNLGDRWAIDASWSDSGELFATSLAFTAKNSVKVVGQKCRSKLPLTWHHWTTSGSWYGTWWIPFLCQELYPFSSSTNTEKAG